MKRPLSVTIVGWIVFISGLFGLISQVFAGETPLARELLADSPLPFAVHRLLNIAMNVLFIGSGVAILKGIDAGRTGYVALSLFGILVSLLTVPMITPILMGLVLTAIIAFFLFRRPADLFFGKSYFGQRANAASD